MPTRNAMCAQVRHKVHPFVAHVFSYVFLVLSNHTTAESRSLTPSKGSCLFKERTKYTKVIYVLVQLTRYIKRILLINIIENPMNVFLT